MSSFEPWNHPLARKIPSWCNKDGTPSKAKYFAWVRGQLRQAWSNNPLRTEWKTLQLRAVTQEEKKNKLFHTSTKNVGQCYLCASWMAGSKLETDHITPSTGCYDFKTAEEFMWHCLANHPDNWALVCKPCHKIKSYAEKEGLTFEEALIEKNVISICKGDDKQWLLSKGITPASNAKLRREQVKDYLMRGVT